MQILDVIRMAVGLVVALWLPGFCISLAIWPREKIWTFQRMIFSVILSIISVPTLTYALNRFGLPFSLLTISLIILIICAISLMIYFFITKHQNKTI